MVKLPQTFVITQNSGSKHLLTRLAFALGSVRKFFAPVKHASHYGSIYTKALEPPLQICIRMIKNDYDHQRDNT